MKREVEKCKDTMAIDNLGQIKKLKRVQQLKYTTGYQKSHQLINLSQEYE